MKKNELRRAVKEHIGDRRELNMWTGPGGAMEYDILLEISATEESESRNLTDKEKLNIRLKYSIEDYELGTYQIGADGCKYLGLFNKNMKNGVYAIKEGDDKYVIEVWRNGRRDSFKRITKNEFEELKRRANER